MVPIVEPWGGGLDHTAYLLNGDLVVRFRRDPAAARAAAEGRLLAFVAEVSPVPVPRPVFVDARRGCMAYPLLPGVPLIHVLNGGWPAALGARLGEVLAALQAVPVEQAAEFAEVDDAPPAEWQEEVAELWPSVAHHVPEQHRPAVEAFVGEPAPPPAPALVFSHQDLGAEHVLVDPATGAVTGIIDWSDAAIGDPARDYGLILRDLGPEALTAALPGDDPELVRRAGFYARCGLIADLAHGVTTGRPEYVTKSLTGLSWLFPH